MYLYRVSTLAVSFGSLIEIFMHVSKITISLVVK